MIVSDNSHKQFNIKHSSAFRDILINKIYHGEDHIRLSTRYTITPDEVIAIINDPKYFPFHLQVRCKITSNMSFAASKHTCIADIDIVYSQGCRLFLSIINANNNSLLTTADQEALNKIRSIIGSVIPHNVPPIKKAKIIHDYLISTSVYDYDNYLNNSIPEESYTPYGLLFSNKAVCQAYAETFMVFMTIIGIECYVVIGALSSAHQYKNQNHAWNIVKVDGKYGHIDITCDNPFPKNYGIPSQNYFFISDKSIRETHTWCFDEYPECK